jgi:hypothetical protein
LDRHVVAACYSRAPEAVTAPGATLRLQAWSAKPPASCRAIFAWNDVDEGYTRGPVARVIRFVSDGIYPVLTSTMRMLWPLKTK